MIRGETGIRGRKPILSEIQKERLFKEIIKRYEKGDNRITFHHIKEFIYEEFNIFINSSSLSNLFSNSKKFKTIIGKPMERSRNQIDPQIIEKYFQEAEKKLNDIEHGFLFNMDEVGFQNWADRKNTKVIVPIEHLGIKKNLILISYNYILN